MFTYRSILCVNKNSNVVFVSAYINILSVAGKININNAKYNVGVNKTTNVHIKISKL